MERRILISQRSSGIGSANVELTLKKSNGNQMTKTMANRIQPPRQSANPKLSARVLLLRSFVRLTSFASATIQRPGSWRTRLENSPTLLRPGVSRDFFHQKIISERQRRRNEHPIHQHAHLVDKGNCAIDFVTQQTKQRVPSRKKIAENSFRIAEKSGKTPLLSLRFAFYP